MKLNPDCIRDLLLFCEKNTYINTDESNGLIDASYHVLYVESMCKCPPLDKYNSGELIYHIIQLSESGYIATDFNFDPQTNFIRGNLPRIYYVTPKGHEFIATISSKDSWAKTSGILKAVKAVSLSIIETVAKGVTEGVVTQYMAALLE